MHYHQYNSDICILTNAIPPLTITKYKVINYHPFLWFKNKCQEITSASSFELNSWQPITREEYELWQEANK